MEGKPDFVNFDYKIPEEERGPWFMTHSGIHFYLFDPHQNEIKIDDIIVHLSVLTRFGGALGTNYSVGAHSLSMALIAYHRGWSETLQLTALMHDAAEAYMGDVVHPFKMELPIVKKVECRIQNMIADKYKFWYPNPSEIKDLDRQMCLQEAKIHGLNTDEWTDPAYKDLNLMNIEEKNIVDTQANLGIEDLQKYFKECFYTLYAKIRGL